MTKDDVLSAIAASCSPKRPARASLCRHGLNTRAKRLGLIAGYAAPYEPLRDPGPE